jgi:hypothetical protein
MKKISNKLVHRKILLKSTAVILIATSVPCQASLETKAWNFLNKAQNILFDLGHKVCTKSSTQTCIKKARQSIISTFQKVVEAKLTNKSMLEAAKTTLEDDTMVQKIASTVNLARKSVDELFALPLNTVPILTKATLASLKNPTDIKKALADAVKPELKNTLDFLKQVNTAKNNLFPETISLPYTIESSEQWNTVHLHTIDSLLLETQTSRLSNSCDGLSASYIEIFSEKDTPKNRAAKALESDAQANEIKRSTHLNQLIDCYF